jgi:CBS domain-containing protein
VFAQSPFHRIVCYDAEKPEQSLLVTRSDITRFVFKKLSYGDQGGDFSTLSDLTLESLGIVGSFDAVYGVSSDTLVIDALRSMKGSVFSAYPIVERQKKAEEFGAVVCSPDDKMTGIFTSSLLKGFTLKNIAHLTMNVLDFTHLQKDSVYDQSLFSSRGTLRQLLDKLNAFKLHRVWILGSNGQPTGVITSGDLIQWIHSFKQT